MTEPVQTRLPLWLDLLAFGFGAGHSPKAPGTMGSLFAAILFPLIASLTLTHYVLWLLVSGIAGVGICHLAAKRMGVHDDPGIVWDEYVGQWIALLPLVPVMHWDGQTVLAVVIGFALFRLFDIWKPWPISWVDKKVHGGLGIMLDDVIAGAIAGLLLYALLPYLQH